MNRPLRRLASLSAGLALAASLASCIAGVGYGGDYGVGGYSPGFVEPYGYDYGAWGGEYRVGPGRGGDRRSSRESHAFHGAPRSRATPSIPRGSRGGGGNHEHR